MDDLYDPEINVRYGSFYLRRLLRKYGDERLALAAYNAGQTNVDEWIASGEGIAFPETREYVDDVLHAREVYAARLRGRARPRRVRTPRPGPATMAAATAEVAGSVAPVLLGRQP